MTTAENGKTANIKIESATVDLAHNTTWELNFADIAAAGDFYDPSTLEGVASTEDGILNVSAPTGGKNTSLRNSNCVQQPIINLNASM